MIFPVLGGSALARKGEGVTKRKYSEVEMIGALKQMEAGGRSILCADCRGRSFLCERKRGAGQTDGG